MVRARDDEGGAGGGAGDWQRSWEDERWRDFYNQIDLGYKNIKKISKLTVGPIKLLFLNKICNMY